MNTPLEPIDQTHAEAMAMRKQIRRHIGRLRAEAAQWEPRPTPTNFR